MKKKVLILRSVSFQQLDKNLEAIEKQFPTTNNQWELHLLTHSHGIPRAKSYKAISQIIDYGSRTNFTIFHLPPCLRKRKEAYEAIVVPVTNMTGAGFLNVMVMALRIPAASIYICNLTSDTWKVSKKKILFQTLKSGLFWSFSLVLLLPFLIIYLLVLCGFFTIGWWGRKRARHQR